MTIRTPRKEQTPCNTPMAWFHPVKMEDFHMPLAVSRRVARHCRFRRSMVLKMRVRIDTDTAHVLRWLFCLLGVVLSLAAAGPGARAIAIKEFPTPSFNSSPGGITTGPDGN